MYAWSTLKPVPSALARPRKGVSPSPCRCPTDHTSGEGGGGSSALSRNHCSRASGLRLKASMPSVLERARIAGSIGVTVGTSVTVGLGAPHTSHAVFLGLLMHVHWTHGHSLADELWYCHCCCAYESAVAGSRTPAPPLRTTSCCSVSTQRITVSAVSPSRAPKSYERAAVCSENQLVGATSGAADEWYNFCSGFVSSPIETRTTCESSSPWPFLPPSHVSDLRSAERATPLASSFFRVKVPSATLRNVAPRCSRATLAASGSHGSPAGGPGTYDTGPEGVGSPRAAAAPPRGGVASTVECSASSLASSSFAVASSALMAAFSRSAAAWFCSAALARSMAARSASSSRAVLADCSADEACALSCSEAWRRFAARAASVDSPISSACAKSCVSSARLPPFAAAASFFSSASLVLRPSSIRCACVTCPELRPLFCAASSASRSFLTSFEASAAASALEATCCALSCVRSAFASLTFCAPFFASFSSRTAAACLSAASTAAMSRAAIASVSASEAFSRSRSVASSAFASSTSLPVSRISTALATASSREARS
mmetsp:Transcript_32242/g.107598  ORF Transcript_32242/g.107598 Transcript_32242/m.107598 type:complete len:549 (-) Transcript_32242:560-2206(-)